MTYKGWFKVHKRDSVKKVEAYYVSLLYMKGNVLFVCRLLSSYFLNAFLCFACLLPVYFIIFTLSENVTMISA